jgi:hypothetical protein
VVDVAGAREPVEAVLTLDDRDRVSGLADQRRHGEADRAHTDLDDVVTGFAHGSLLLRHATLAPALQPDASFVCNSCTAAAQTRSVSSAPRW